MGVFNNDHDHDEPFVRYHSNVNRTILLYVFMVSFITVLFLVFALYLYARCVLRGRSRNRAAIRRLTIAALHVSDLEAAAAAHRHAEPPHSGLDPAIIASLPTFAVRTKVLENGGDGGGGGGGTVVECAVCLSALEGEEKAKLLPNCNHFFHVNCIDKWLDSQSTCPICRAEVKPRLQPQEREGPVALSLESALALLSSVNDDGNNNDNDESSKINDSNSRLSSFRRILSRERSSRRVQPSGHNDEDGGVDQDLERQ